MNSGASAILIAYLLEVATLACVGAPSCYFTCFRPLQWNTAKWSSSIIPGSSCQVLI